MAAKNKQGFPKVVTANNLKNGLTVFLKTDGNWTCNINEAAIAESKKDIEQLFMIGKEAEASNFVVAPYLVDVELTDKGTEPIHIREYIRAMCSAEHEDLWKRAV